MPSEKVKFQNKRGKTLVGNFWEADSNTAIVMSHGISGDKSEYGFFDKVAEVLRDVGYTVLAFDFAGAGESDFELFTVKKEVEDLSAALEYCRSRGIDRFGLFGYSLGGLISLRNYRDDVEAMALVAPTTDSFDLSEGNRWSYFARVFRILPFIRKKKKRMMLAKADIIGELASVTQEELLNAVECPTLVIHGEQDDIVPPEDSKEAVEELENGELKIIDDMEHVISGEHIRKIADLTADWFRQHCPP